MFLFCSVLYEYKIQFLNLKDQMVRRKLFVPKRDLSDQVTILKKGKGQLVQALRLCIGLTAHRVSRGITLPFHDHGTRRG